MCHEIRPRMSDMCSQYSGSDLSNSRTIGSTMVTLYLTSQIERAALECCNLQKKNYKKCCNRTHLCSIQLRSKTPIQELPLSSLYLPCNLGVCRSTQRSRVNTKQLLQCMDVRFGPNMGMNSHIWENQGFLRSYFSTFWLLSHFGPM